VAIVANAVAGTLALVAWRVPRVRGRVVWIATIAAEVAVLLQVLVGVILVASHRYEAPRFHMFYGFVIFITVGLLYQYRGSMKGRLEMLYGFGGLFIMGLGIRAVLQVVR
jgi:heme A synthase